MPSCLPYRCMCEAIESAQLSRKITSIFFYITLLRVALTVIFSHNAAVRRAEKLHVTSCLIHILFGINRTTIVRLLCDILRLLYNNTLIRRFVTEQ